MIERNSPFGSGLAIAAMMGGALALGGLAPLGPQRPKSPIERKLTPRQRRAQAHDTNRRANLAARQRRDRNRGKDSVTHRLINSMTNWQRHQWAKAFRGSKMKKSERYAMRMRPECIKKYASLARR